MKGKKGGQSEFFKSSCTKQDLDLEVNQLPFDTQVATTYILQVPHDDKYSSLRGLRTEASHWNVIAPFPASVIALSPEKPNEL
jgi:hypothetical protein